MLTAMSLWAAPVPAAQLTVLPNGMQILVQEDDRFPLVALRLYVHAGSAYETPPESGISHLLEHMVFKGTEKYGPGGVAREIESVGGYLNAATSFDQTTYIVDVPSEQWSLGLDVLREMIFGMTLDQESLDQEKKVVLSELERNEDDPGRLIFQSLQSLVWPGSSYARPVIGDRGALAAMTRQDIKAYLDRLYLPQSMLLVVCGRVQNEAVVARCRDLFSSFANQGTSVPPGPIDMPGGQAGASIRVQKGPWRKVYMGVALPVPGFRAAEEPGLEVLAQLLGGDKTSLFYRKFKHELGVVDDISVSAVLLERGGMMYVSIQLDADKVELFWRALIQELSTLRSDLFSPREIDRAKLNIEDSLFQSKETLGGLASKIGYFQFHEKDLEAEDRYLHHLRRVDQAELDAMIQIHVQPWRVCASLLLPQELDLGETFFREEIRQSWPGVQAHPGMTPEPLPVGGGHEIIDLGHGQSLVLIPDPTLPYTSLSLVWPGGDLLLDEDQDGLAALAARALTRGTASRNATQIREYLSDRATHMSTLASRDQFSLNVKFPVRFSDDVLELLEDILKSPTWPGDEVDRVKGEQAADIVEREDQPLGLLFRHAFPFLFNNRPYSFFHLGGIETIRSFTPQQLDSFWRRQVRQPLVMAACGQFEREKIVALAKTLAGGDGQPAVAVPEPQWSETKTLRLELPERNQEHLLVVFPVPGIEHPDSGALALLKTVLAGQGGILFRELRDEQGLGYSVTAMLWQLPRAGFLAFYIGTYPDKAEQALEGFRSIAVRLRQTPVAAQDLIRAKNLMVGDYYREHQSLGSRSGEAAELAAYGLDLGFNRKQIEDAQARTPEDLQTLARYWLDWDKAHVLRVAP